MYLLSGSKIVTFVIYEFTLQIVIKLSHQLNLAVVTQELGIFSKLGRQFF